MAWPPPALGHALPSTWRGARPRKRGMGTPHAACAVPQVPPRLLSSPGGTQWDTGTPLKGAEAAREQSKSSHLTNFGGDGEARGHIEAKVRHLTEVGALATQLQREREGRGDNNQRVPAERYGSGRGPSGARHAWPSRPCHASPRQAHRSRG